MCDPLLAAKGRRLRQRLWVSTRRELEQRYHEAERHKMDMAVKDLIRLRTDGFHPEMDRDTYSIHVKGEIGLEPLRYLDQFGMTRKIQFLMRGIAEQLAEAMARKYSNAEFESFVSRWSTGKKQSAF